MRNFPCGLCHGDQFTFLHRHEDKYRQPVQLVVCDRCGLTQLNPRRDEQEQARFYASDFYQLHGLHEKHAKSARWISRKQGIAAGILDRLAEHRPLDGLRLLDIGCGHGFLLREARQRGALVHGVEPDPEAASSLRKQGFDIFNGALQAFVRQATDEFHMVTISHVVEHVNLPIPFLKTAATLLRADGLLAAEVPNLTWQLLYGRHPGSAHSAHVYYYSEATLRELFAVSGLSVLAVAVQREGRNLCAVGQPTAARALGALPIEDPAKVGDLHLLAVRRLRRQWPKQLVRVVKRRIRRYQEGRN